MIEIWGRSNSVNVQKVLWCCEELGLPYQRTDAGGPFGRTAEPDYLALNPTGLVPTLVVGGLTLWESNAIVRYLCARYGHDSLDPSDPGKHAEADQWMDWQTAMVWTRLRPAFIALVRTPAEQRDMAAVTSAVNATADLMSILDKHLERNRYVLGALFSMADIPLGATVNRWFTLDIERPPMTHLKAWHQRLLERPAYKKIVASIPLT